MGSDSKRRMEFSRQHERLPAARLRRVLPWLLGAAAFLGCASGCDVERRKSDAELGLNAQQAVGRHVYDNICGRCHEPYSARGKNGPGLRGVFKKEYLSESGLPANDERVGDIIRYGRAKMPAYGQVLDQQQIQDLLAYMHTL
jgi:mono/diheme cytochrome c family protein